VCARGWVGGSPRSKAGEEGPSVHPCVVLEAHPGEENRLALVVADAAAVRKLLASWVPLDEDFPAIDDLGPAEEVNV
jgi:hypothetical protein